MLPRVNKLPDTVNQCSSQCRVNVSSNMMMPIASKDPEVNLKRKKFRPARSPRCTDTRSARFVKTEKKSRVWIHDFRV